MQQRATKARQSSFSTRVLRAGWPFSIAQTVCLFTIVATLLCPHPHPSPFTSTLPVAVTARAARLTSDQIAMRCVHPNTHPSPPRGSVTEWFFVLATCNALSRPTFDPEDMRCGLRVQLRAPVGLGLVAIVATVYVASALFMCGDIELNPGPSTTEEAGHGGGDLSNDNAILKALDSAVKRLEAQQETHATRLEQNMKDMRETVIASLSRVEQEQQDQQESITTMQEQLYYLQRENVKLIDKIDNLENHSRRNNLIFFGLEVQRNEGWDACERKVKETIKDGMGIKDEIHIERAHPIGNQGAIVVKLLMYKQKTLILSNSRSLKNSDQYNKVFVREDFSNVVRHKRRMLKDKAKELTDKGIQSKLRFDKLLTQDCVYMFDTDRDAVVQRARTTGSQDKDRGAEEEGAVGGQTDRLTDDGYQGLLDINPLDWGIPDQHNTYTDKDEQERTVGTAEGEEETNTERILTRGQARPPAVGRGSSRVAQPSVAGRTRSTSGRGAAWGSGRGRRASSPLGLPQTRKDRHTMVSNQMTLDSTLGLQQVGVGAKPKIDTGNTNRHATNKPTGTKDSAKRGSKGRGGESPK